MRFLPDFENWRRWRNGCWWRGGGWFTPLSATLSFADWVRDEQLPVILVVGIKLGCINHALLTAQAVRQAGLPLVGWIANDIQPPGKRHAEYLATLNDRLAAPLLGEIPWLADASRREDLGQYRISARWIGRHPLCQQRFIQLDNAALRHVTPAMQQAKRSATRRINGRCCSASSTVKPMSRFRRTSRSPSLCTKCCPAARRLIKNQQTRPDNQRSRQRQLVLVIFRQHGGFMLTSSVEIRKKS